MLECIDDEIIEYLIDHLSSKELISAIQVYQGYKADHYGDYLLKTYFWKDFTKSASKFVDEVIKGALPNGVSTLGFEMLFSFIDEAFKLESQFIGLMTGLGDADDFIIASKAYNYYQEIYLSMSDVEERLRKEPITQELLDAYEACYELYLSALAVFAEQTEDLNENLRGGIEHYLAIFNSCHNGSRYSVEDHYENCRRRLSLASEAN